MTQPEPRDDWERNYLERNQTTTTASPEASSQSGLIGAGIATAILLPVVGLIIGIVLLFKSRIGPGLGCIVLSVIAAVVYITVVSPAVFKDERSTGGIQTEITRWAEENTKGGASISTDCPDPIEWRVGETFNCIVTQGNQTVRVVVTMENDAGDVTWITG